MMRRPPLLLIPLGEATESWLTRPGHDNENAEGEDEDGGPAEDLEVYQKSMEFGTFELFAV